VRAVRDLLDRLGSRAVIGVDGGVSPANAAALVAAGAGLLVAASAIYGSADPAAATVALRTAATAAVAS
jgi:ribulose-phosphate 3-epimerase